MATIRALSRVIHRGMSRTVRSAVTLSEAQAWASQVVTNGGTVSAGRLTIVDNFINAEKAAGSWDLTDDYWPLWGENAPQGLTSLKQRRLATAVAAPTFTTDRGYTFDGVANYVTTLFNPLTHAVAMTGTNGRSAVYERVDVSTNTISMGVVQNGNSNMQLIARSATAAFGRFNMSAGMTYTLAPATALGWTAASRNGSVVGSCFVYKNGVSLAQVATSPTFNPTNPNGVVYIGANNSSGTAATFRAASVGFACIGAALSAAQETAQYNNVQAWATSIGANV